MPEGAAIPVVWELPANIELPTASPPQPQPPAAATPPQAARQSPQPTLPQRMPAARPAPRQSAQAPAPAPAPAAAIATPEAAKPTGDTASVAESPPSPTAPAVTAAPPEAPEATTSTSLAAVPAGRATGWSVLLRDPPKYPPAARRRGIEGEVILLAEVGADGAVEVVSLLRSSGYAELDDAAMTAVEKWRFRAPSRLSIQIPITFRLDND